MKKKLFDLFLEIYANCDMVYIDGVIVRNIHDRDNIYGIGREDYENFTRFELESYDVKNKVLRLKNSTPKRRLPKIMENELENLRVY